MDERSHAVDVRARCLLLLSDCVATWSRRTRLEGGYSDDPFFTPAVHYTQLEREVASAQGADMEARPRGLDAEGLDCASFAFVTLKPATML
jgi:hypothetical protein